MLQTPLEISSLTITFIYNPIFQKRFYLFIQTQVPFLLQDLVLFRATAQKRIIFQFYVQMYSIIVFLQCLFDTLVALWGPLHKSKQYGQNQRIWLKSNQNGPNLAWGPSFWPLNLYCGLQYLDFYQIWAILPGFGPLCLGLGDYAWIWAILLRFGSYCDYAWIWAILLKFGSYCLDLGYLAELGSE